ncbi:unnamed protein product [Toxocara canis]|uniref:Miff domain-containing protein n=1 Tax=Toxocara canis TaxID=6265 RepID=A0A183VGT4_TOXCA|nr:unnamed protein product [Toxocara canis]
MKNGGLILSATQPRAETLDPNEDPVSGLERVSSITNLNAEQKRRKRLEAELEESERIRRQKTLSAELALSSQFESLDYEYVENQLYKNEESDPDHQQILFRKSLNRWVVCFLIGVCTGCVAAFIDMLIHFSSEVKFRLIINRCK